jgi:hypothetical protein
MVQLKITLACIFFGSDFEMVVFFGYHDGNLILANVHFFAFLPKK